MRLSDSATPGWGWKAAGCGGCAVLAMYGISVLVGILVGPLRLFGQSVACQGNVFRQARAFRMYADDYDERFPPADKWMDRTFFYLAQERYLHCPAASRPGARRFGYAMNGEVSGKARSSIADPDTTPLTFDSPDLARSAVAKGLALPSPGRHITRPRQGAQPRRGNFVGYAVGNARFVPDTRGTQRP